MLTITAASLRQTSRSYSKLPATASENLRRSYSIFAAGVSKYRINIIRNTFLTRKNHTQVNLDIGHTDHSTLFPTTKQNHGVQTKFGTIKNQDRLKDPKADQGTRPIYLDMQATTPLDPRVLDRMLPLYFGQFGNPHSRTHLYGWETEILVEDARKEISHLIGADPKEIIFTSGATESNNMSIKGVARFCGKSGKKRHIITTQTEHKCVLDSCRHLQNEGFSVTYLPVQPNGLINLDELEEAIKPNTAIVSVMMVNNEIGVIQPIEEIGKICLKKKVYFHTDAAQAVGKIPIDVNQMNIDLMSISSHKIYGPKGIGACYVRRRPRVRLEPIISGGGQERGLRSGTLAPALVVGFGEACRIAEKEMVMDGSCLFKEIQFDE